MNPIVTIIGRSNVGKSTLFNRITEEWASIVDNKFEVTRDLIYKQANWQNYNFFLTDTGGLQGRDNNFNKLIKQQTLFSINEANIILMIVDSKTGITNDDIEIAKIIKKEKKPIILVVNKVDNFNKNNFYEFYSLGLGDPISVSAIHGNNIGDLLDLIIKYFKKLKINCFSTSYNNIEKEIKIALIGCPNVGKSTFLNKVSNKNRSIVSDIPGTTRDSLNEKVIAHGKEYMFIDTAGIRKKSKISDFLEKTTILHSIKSIEKSDIVFLLISATEEITEQDKKIAEIIIKNGKATIIIVNKWDAIEKNNKSTEIFKNKIKEKFYFLNFAPILFVSALTGQRINEIYKLIENVFKNTNKKIETSIINNLLQEIISFNPPPKHKGKTLKINYVTQIKIAPPSFVFFVNDVKLVHFSYKRHIENKFREAFDFTGTPIRIYFRNKKEKNSV